MYISNHSPWKGTGDPTTYSLQDHHNMKVHLSRNHNSVNRGSVITPTPALGKDALITQGALDRHQAIEFNTKIR